MTESSILVVLFEKNMPIDTTNLLHSVMFLILTAFKEHTWYSPLSKRPLNQMVNLAPN